MPILSANPDNPTPNRIREWRMRRHMSLAELGQAVGLSRSEISKLETGSRRVRADHLVAIAKALRVRPDDLMSTAAVRELLGDDDINTITAGGASTHAAPRDTLGELPILSLRRSSDGLSLDADAAAAFTPRPPQLARIAGAYALPMMTDGLEPRVPMGALLYVDPIMPPRAGDLGIVRFTNGQIKVAAINRNNSGSLVAQDAMNSRDVFELTDQNVSAVHRVVGMWLS